MERNLGAKWKLKQEGHCISDIARETRTYSSTVRKYLTLGIPPSNISVLRDSVPF